MIISNYDELRFSQLLSGIYVDGMDMDGYMYRLLLRYEINRWNKGVLLSYAIFVYCVWNGVS